ncbi:glycosyltransferase family 2 protein [Candidatus Thiosymbion oneisti]|uniref:glycosyltransferase family 2 protein n=1 Tax=Candidatus Thiosymbion oneisti TaxID=589554 RepID=UPI000A4B48EF|nr:glycosyltransferase family 2 protein [Candidatus Thiosymbion oneisti]
MKNHPRILVFIPAYRCKAQVVRVLDQFDQRVQAWIHTVMVVDNRSPDGTLQAAIDRGTARIIETNFIAWRNDDNYGLGGSHKAAFRYAVEQKMDYVVVLHGDDQADIRDLVPLLEEGVHEQVDCLLGARFMSGSRLKGYSWFRTFGNRLYNKIFSFAVLRNIYDLGSGLNLYRVSSLQEFYYKSFPDDLTFNYVMLLASYHRGQNVRFFPISWREEDQISNVKMFRQAFKVLGLLAGYFFQRGSFLASELRGKAFDRYSGQIKCFQEAKFSD